MSLKNTRYLLLAPLAGLLALPACTTTAERPTRNPSAASAPADPAVGATRAYLVNLSKKAPTVVSVGDTFTYELNASAQVDVAETTIVETLRPGAAYVSSVPAAVLDGNKLIWKLGNMNRGESKAILVTLKATQEGEVANCATVSALPRVCVSTMVGRAQLVIRKTGPEMAQLGQSVTYTITVQNAGNTIAKNVVVTDPVPEGFSSATGQKEISFSVGDLPAGASRPMQVTLRADKRGKLWNKALATSSNAGKAEAEICTTIVQAGIKIEKKTDNPEVFVNRSASYEIVVSNPGDVTLTKVVVTDTAAAETVIAAADGAVVSGNTATWNLDTLRAGEKKSLSVKILSKVAGQFSGTASVTCAQGLKDSAQTWTLWKGVTGVLVEMADQPDPIQVGETSKFIVRVTNQGSTMDMSNLNIVATLPAELEVVPGTVSDGGVVSGKTITWPTVSKVAPKASVGRTYTAKAVKAGDARSKVAITTSMRKEPIENFESTTVY
jgi:uncharacterized repeat protein (TIGR01451 family)